MHSFSHEWCNYDHFCFSEVSENVKAMGSVQIECDTPNAYILS